MKTNTPIILLLLVLILVSCSSRNTDLIAKGAELTLVADNYKFTEGPAVDFDGNVFFTDQPNNRIIKWTASNNTVAIFMEPSGRANGLYFDNEGNLLACADDKFELWSIDIEKNISILVDNFEGKKLNGPNDLWLDDKGGFYITDPYYQRPYWKRTKKEIEKECVYYLSPDKNILKVVVDDFVKPNGIIGTPDGKLLYVSDRGAEKTYSYSINQDGSLSNKKLFIEEGSDGMTIDNKGNVYITNENGVTVFNKKGIQVLNIPVDKKWTANVTFGGPQRNILFITAMNSIYTLKMNVSGVR